MLNKNMLCITYNNIKMDSKSMVKIAGQGIGLLIGQLKSNAGTETQPIFIDPLCTIIKLGIIGFKPAETKCGFYDNTICIEEPWKLQGVYRMFSRAERDQLHHLNLTRSRPCTAFPSRFLPASSSGSTIRGHGSRRLIIPA